MRHLRIDREGESLWRHVSFSWVQLSMVLMFCAKTCVSSSMSLLSHYSHGDSICSLLIQNEQIRYLNTTFCAWQNDHQTPFLISVTYQEGRYPNSRQILLTILIAPLVLKSINCKVREASKIGQLSTILLWWGIITEVGSCEKHTLSLERAWLEKKVTLTVALVLPCGMKRVVVSEKFSD